MSLTQPQLMSVSEFAAAIGKAERQVYRYVKRGQVSVLTEDLNGRTVVRIPHSEVERFIQQGMTGQDTAQPMSGPSPDSVRTGQDSLLDLDDEDVEESVPYLQPAPSIPLERHESVVMRLGWLEAQLEMSRKMLGDGGAMEAELREQVAREAEARRQAEIRAAEARAEVELLGRQLAEAQQLLQKPWWKKMMGS